MQVLRYPCRHGAISHTSAHRRRDGYRHFARPLRSRALEHSRQTAEDPGRHELHGDDAEAQSLHAEIDLLPALPHSSRSGIDRERTPRRGPLEPRPRRGIGDAFSRPLGFDPQIVQKRNIAPGAVRPRFIVDNGNVWGRPVATTELKDGSLLLSDDGGNVIYRISHAPLVPRAAGQTLVFLHY